MMEQSKERDEGFRDDLNGEAFPSLPRANSSSKSARAKRVLYGTSFGYGSPLHGSCQGLSAMAHHSMVRAKASRLWLTTPLNSGAIPNLVQNFIFLIFFSMARAYGTTTPSATMECESESCENVVNNCVENYVNQKNNIAFTNTEYEC
ncbi:hypothetical protein Tco_0743758 [Tanacetum coccineum]